MSGASLADLTLSEVAAAIRAREVSAREATEAWAQRAGCRVWYVASSTFSTARPSLLNSTFF